MASLLERPLHAKLRMQNPNGNHWRLSDRTVAEEGPYPEDKCDSAGYEKGVHDGCKGMHGMLAIVRRNTPRQCSSWLVAGSPHAIAPVALGALYLWSPLAVAAAVGGSPGGLENAAVFAALAAGAAGAAPLAAAALAAAAYLGLQPLLLTVPSPLPSPSPPPLPIPPRPGNISLQNSRARRRRWSASCASKHTSQCKLQRICRIGACATTHQRGARE